MGMAVPIYFTADQVRALPDDGNRYEVVRRLLVALSSYLEAEPVGWVLPSAADISWAEVWTPDDAAPRFERERLVWRPAGAGAAFELALSELFREI